MVMVLLETLESRVRDYVHLAEEGETVLVKSHDRVVAELVPPRARSPVLEDIPALAAGIREGWLTPALEEGPEPPPRQPVTRLEDLLDDLSQSRSDR